MNVPSLPKSLQAALLASAVSTGIALLKPETIETPVNDTGNPSIESNQTASTRHVEAPWIRMAGEEWKPSDIELQRAADAIAAAAPPVVQPEPVVAPPRPVAPNPSLIYLGRIEQGGRRYVFLGRGSDPQVVEIGGLVDAQWKVEKATATEVQLRYLPLNEVRSIPIAAMQ
jgi:hypothetical protein